ncbi:MAG: uroporphyrinogen decarboxylase [Anaerolineae bacterium]|nr:uroporphyrinogen decarboxylase [Anaerolineae bacterium]
MNKRQRLEATISGEPVDRVAVALWRHWPGDDQRAEDQAAAHINFQRDYDWDFIKVSPASSFCLTAWGVEDRWEGSMEGTRRYTKRVVEKPEDWSQLKVLEPSADGLGRQLQCLECLEESFKEEVPYIQTVFSPLAQAKNLASDDTLIVHLRQNAGQVHHALQVITDTTVAFIHEAKRRGIAGIYYAVQHASYLKMTEAEYQVFGRPYDLQILAAANELWLNALHVHGAHIMFNLLADYPVQFVNWHDREAPPDLETGLKKIKGAASGGISRDVLHNEDPEAALDQARDAMQQTEGHRWILGTGCVVLATTPVGNIRKVRTLADEL